MCPILLVAQPPIAVVSHTPSVSLCLRCNCVAIAVCCAWCVRLLLSWCVRLLLCGVWRVVCAVVTECVYVCVRVCRARVHLVRRPAVDHESGVPTRACGRATIRRRVSPARSQLPAPASVATSAVTSRAPCPRCSGAMASVAGCCPVPCLHMCVDSGATAWMQPARVGRARTPALCRDRAGAATTAPRLRAIPDRVHRAPRCVVPVWMGMEMGMWITRYPYLCACACASACAPRMCTLT